MPEKKTILSFVIILLILTGCNKVVQPNTPVKLYTPSKYNVIKKGSKIYFQSQNSDHYNSKKLIQDIKNYFKQNNIFKIVSKKQSADVIINIDTFYSFRKDNNKDIQYNQKDFVETIVYRDKNGNETGGKDVLKKNRFNSTTATLVTSIAIYERKTLQPLVYFDITPSNSSKLLNNEKSNLISNKDYLRDLTQNVVKKLEDIVSTKTKDVNIFVPTKATKSLKASLLSHNTDQLFKEAKKILPEFDILEASLEKYKANALAASQKDSKIIKRDMELDLSNFYIMLVAKESIDVSKANILYVYKGFQNILKLTKDPSLILATSNSLGRIEFKANRLNINLGAYYE